MPDSFGLEGRVAIVTGGGRGLGRAIALALAGQGVRVVVNDLGVPVDHLGSDPTVADEAVCEIETQGGHAIANHDSVASAAGARRIVETAIDGFGRLDILVNNAGIFRPSSFINTSDDRWDEVVGVNLRGTFLCTKAAVPHMASRGWGRVINISSKSALGQGARGGSGDRASYSAAKAGVLGLTWALAYELAPHGITCNALMPSVQSRMAAGDRPEDASPSRPQDVAPFVVSLAAAGAEVNGQVFFCTKGRLELYSRPAVIATWETEGAWSIAAGSAALREALGLPTR